MDADEKLRVAAALTRINQAFDTFDPDRPLTEDQEGAVLDYLGRAADDLRVVLGITDPAQDPKPE